MRGTPDDQEVHVARHAARLVDGTDVDIGAEDLGERVGDGVRVAVHGFEDDQRFHAASIQPAARAFIGTFPHHRGGVPPKLGRCDGRTVAG